MANLWKSFEDLLPKQRFIIGVVDSIDATFMVSTVILLSGESLTVKGTNVAIGNTCLIKDGIIFQEIPGLTPTAVTIY
jgi:hypothetical protein